MNKEELFLSIIIPIYNPEIEDFVRCIDSISKIEIPNEIIIVDDGSEERKNKDICRKYLMNIRKFGVHWLEKSNGGVSSARNKGIEKAKGKYLLFVDVDDTVTEEFVSFINSKYSLISAEWVLFDILEFHTREKVYVSREIIKKDSKDYKRDIEDVDFCDVMEARMDRTKLAECWGKLVLRSILIDKKILFPEGARSGEDSIFNTRLLRNINHIQYVPLKAYIYHYTPRGRMRTLADPYSRFKFMEIGWNELKDLINIKADDNRKKYYLQTGNMMRIESLFLDSCDLLCAKKMDSKMKQYVSDLIDRNGLFDSLTIRNCSSFKELIYFLTIKYRLWKLIRYLGIIRQKIGQFGDRKYSK